MPLFAAAFRPFYLLGIGYATLLVGLAAPALSGVAPAAFPMAWHGHEMVFGFAVAIIVGTLLTALPSWAGTPETEGRPLMLLVACWALGRLACAHAGSWPWGLVAACDLALPVAVIILLVPQLRRLPQRRWWLAVAVFAGLAGANLAWHLALQAGYGAGAATAVRAALWAVLAMYTLAGGLLTPVFTANVLAERGRGAPRPASPPLEVLALLALLGAAVADVAARPALLGPLALAACALQGWRVARWRGWRAASEPLVGAMHIGFAWLLVALALKAGHALGAPWHESLWVHAFTAGALGSMMLGLMTRVALRHTGRPLTAPPMLPWLLGLVTLATLLRLAAPSLGPWAWAASALPWAGAMGIWLLRHAPMMLRASLPREGPGEGTTP